MKTSLKKINELPALLNTGSVSECVQAVSVPVKYTPALRRGFLSVFGFSTVVDELASSVVCSDMCECG